MAAEATAMADTSMEKGKGVVILTKRTASKGWIEKEIEAC